MNEPRPATSVTEDIVRVDLTESEWKIMQILRQIRFGHMTIFKQAGSIIRIEPTPSIQIKEGMDIRLPVGVV